MKNLIKFAPETEAEKRMLKQQFESLLLQMQRDLCRSLASTEILPSETRCSLASCFEAELLCAVDHWRQSFPMIRKRNSQARLKRLRATPLPCLAGSIAGVWIGLQFCAIVPAANAGWVCRWFGRKQAVTIAARLAAYGGVPLSLATGGLSIAIAFAGAWIAWRASAAWQRQRLRRLIMLDYEQRIIPELRQWADECMTEAFEIITGSVTVVTSERTSAIERPVRRSVKKCRSVNSRA